MKLRKVESICSGGFINRKILPHAMCWVVIGYWRYLISLVLKKNAHGAKGQHLTCQAPSPL
jgi:hypothetical protein